MRAKSFVATLSLAVALSACQQAGDSAESRAATLDTLTQLREQHVNAVLEENVDEELATYSNSAVVIPPDHQVVIGSEEIRTWLEGFFDSFNVEQLEIDAADPTVQGDLAITHYRYRWSLGPEGGELIRDTGNGLWVFERQADGGWLIVYDIWNSDGGGPDNDR